MKNEKKKGWKKERKNEKKKERNKKYKKVSCHDTDITIPYIPRNVAHWYFLCMGGLYLGQCETARCMRYMGMGKHEYRHKERHKIIHTCIHT